MTRYQLILIFGLFVANSESKNCSEYVTQESKGLLHYLAQVSFPAPKEHNGTWSLELFTDYPYTFLGGWGVVIDNDGDNGKAIMNSTDTRSQVGTGDRISFRFRIAWFTGESVPHVIGLKWLGFTICAPPGTTISAVQASKQTESEPIRRQRLPVN